MAESSLKTTWMPLSPQDSCQWKEGQTSGMVRDVPTREVEEIQTVMPWLWRWLLTELWHEPQTSNRIPSAPYAYTALQVRYNYKIVLCKIVVKKSFIYSIKMESYENLKISMQKLKMFKNITPGYSTLRELNTLTEGLRNLIKY